MKNFTKTLIAFCVFGFGTAIQAQEVVATSGDYFENSSGSISWTIGEPKIETFESANNILTQGFHQTKLTIISIDEEEMLGDISVYPNPAKQDLIIDIPSHYSDSFNALLYDAGGKLLSQKELISGTATMEMHNLATGTYYLRIINSVKKQQKEFKILKIK